MINTLKYYNDKNSDYFTSDRTDVLNFCKKNNINFDNKKILEIGCGSGLTLNKIRNSNNNTDVTGVDLYATDIINGINVQKLSLEEFIANNSLKDFDYILILDVLEHLIDPWDILIKINNDITNKTKLIISLPNVSDFIFFKKLLLKNSFGYTSKGGIFDQTHLRFFTENDMIQMFTATNFNILISSSNYLYNNSIRKYLHYLLLGFFRRFYTLQYFFILNKNG